MSIVKYDDTGGDRDFNDLVLEVAIVGRQSWSVLAQAENQAATNKLIQKEGIPRLKALVRKLPKEKQGVRISQK